MSIIEVLDSREVREDRVRKPYGWDSVELETLVNDRVWRKYEGKVSDHGITPQAEVPASAEEERHYDKKCHKKRHLQREVIQVEHAARQLGEGRQVEQRGT